MEAIEDNTEGEKKLFIPDPNSDSRCLIKLSTGGFLLKVQK